MAKLAGTSINRGSRKFTVLLAFIASMYGATLAGGVPVGHAADMRRSGLHEAGGDGCPAEVKVPALAQNECRLTFSGYEGKETLKNFPALIKIPDGLTGFDYRDSTVAGSDIAFFGAYNSHRSNSHFFERKQRYGTENDNEKTGPQRALLVRERRQV